MIAKPFLSLGTKDVELEISWVLWFLCFIFLETCDVEISDSDSDSEGERSGHSFSHQLRHLAKGLRRRCRAE